MKKKKQVCSNFFLIVFFKLCLPVRLSSLLSSSASPGISTHSIMPPYHPLILLPSQIAFTGGGQSVGPYKGGRGSLATPGSARQSLTAVTAAVEDVEKEVFFLTDGY